MLHVKKCSHSLKHTYYSDVIALRKTDMEGPKPWNKLYSLSDTGVEPLGGSEANDGVGNCGSIDWGEASYGRQDHCILHTVVAGEKK